MKRIIILTLVILLSLAFSQNKKEIVQEKDGSVLLPAQRFYSYTDLTTNPSNFENN